MLENLFHERKARSIWETIYIDCRLGEKAHQTWTNAFYLFIARHAFRLSPPIGFHATHSIHRFSLSVLPFIISGHGDLYLVHAYLQKWHDLPIGFPVFFHLFFCCDGFNWQLATAWICNKFLTPTIILCHKQGRICDLYKRRMFSSLFIVPP